MSQPFFIPITSFKEFGLPCKTKSYELSKLGLLALVKDLAGRVGVTSEEAQRFVSCARPLGEAKRDLSRATAASLKARHDRA